MRITLLALGSRGDVEPFIALGAGLRSDGHAVTLATSRSFAGAVAQAGLFFADLEVDLQALAQTPGGRAALGSVRGRIAIMRQAREGMWASLNAALAATENADLIVYHPKVLAAPHIAEARGISAIIALPLPALTPTASFPTPLLPLPALGATLNKASHWVVLALLTAGFRGMIDAWRRDRLRLGPARHARTSLLEISGRPVPRFYPFSPALVAPPPDWPSGHHVTGPWTLQPSGGWTPPEGLEAFLADGPPPVYVGFGSMATGDAKARTSLILEALRRAGQRGILAAGWGGLAPVDHPEVHFLAEAPHDWLFPRVSAVIHHGGAGTTHAGLRHGKPTLICPVFGDQPFWGRRVAALGAGPAPLPLRRLTVGALAAAIKVVCGNPQFRNRASSIAEAMAGEDGVAAAIALIERYAGSR